MCVCVCVCIYIYIYISDHLNYSTKNHFLRNKIIPLVYNLPLILGWFSMCSYRLL